MLERRKVGRNFVSVKGREKACRVAEKADEGRKGRGESREDINLPRPNVLTHAFLSDVSVTAPPALNPILLCLVFRARVRIYLDSRQGPASRSSVDDSRSAMLDEERGEAETRRERKLRDTEKKF